MKNTSIPTGALRYASGEELLLLTIFKSGIGSGSAGSALKRSIDRELDRRAILRRFAEQSRTPTLRRAA
jgi:hypothetical protein